MKQESSFRSIVFWTCASTGCGLFVLLGLGRSLILEEMRMGIEPFMPLWSVQWVAAGFVVFAIAGLCALSRLKLNRKMAKVAKLTPAVTVLVFTLFLIFEMFTAKKTEPWERINHKPDHTSPTNQ